MVTSTGSRTVREMSTQYLRRLSLIVATPSGAGLEFGSFRVVFETHRGDTQTPNTCDIKIYNLQQSTANQLAPNGGVSEFTQLLLKVAYGSDPLMQIFYGSIKQTRRGREDQLNSYVAITAADGDEAYNFAPAAFTLASGAVQQTAFTNLIQAMAQASLASTPVGQGSGQPITQGYAPTMSPTPLIRGRTYYGACRDEMRSLAKAADCTWSIQDGKVTFIPKTSYIPGDPVLISPTTGLIGVPEQTQNGLEVRTLLNPNIKIGQTIKLQSTDINALRYGLDNQSVSTNFSLQQGAAATNADGLYYVMRAEHSGDTRGNNWYTDLVCIAINATVTAAQSVQQAAITPPAVFQY
jgi:hypothetical protein